MKKSLKNKEAKELVAQLKELFNLDFSKKDKFEIQDKILLINNEPLFFYFEEKLAPTLKLILKNNFLKKITVDMGAVPYAAKGADMMRPGITKIDEEIEKGQIVSIVDMTHNKPLAIGLTLFSGQDIREMNKGKVVKNIHHIGDDIWNFS